VIVISGALVLVALILLIVGITLPELTYVYASILVSLVSFAFLLIGILQRRGDKGGSKGDASADRTAVTAGAPSSAAPQVEVREEPTVAVVPAPARSRGSVVVGDAPAPAPAPVVRSAEPEPAEPDEDLYDDEDIDPADDRAVLIVAGRPRYHAEGCRYLNGKSPETIHLLDARDEGFTPCGVCKPDNVVAIEQGVAVVPAEEGVDAVVDVVPASSVPEAPSTTDLGTVVIIPDRGRFHRSACRYVKNASDTRTRTRPQAVGEGYVPCGVCKP
jgi:hypothetical protein